VEYKAKHNPIVKRLARAIKERNENEITFSFIIPS